MIGWIVGLVIVAVILGYCFVVWKTTPAQRSSFTDGVIAAQRQRGERERQKAADKRLQKARNPANKPISQVGKPAAGGAGLACPVCGGAQFKARRSKAARVGIAGATLTTGGLAGLGAAAVTKQKKVQCVTCGTIYQRG